MKALIFASGKLENSSKLQHISKTADLIVAADGGANHCHRLNITPDVLLGDLDSIEPDVLAHYKKQDIEIRKYPTRKDATDLELALDLVLTRGAQSVQLLGALGGRWDMSLANITLTASKKYTSLQISLLAHDCCIHILHSGKPFTVKGIPGQTVSFTPLNGDVYELTLTGFEYPLEKSTVPFGSTLGISNVLSANSGSVLFKRGTLLCTLLLK